MTISASKPAAPLNRRIAVAFICTALMAAFAFTQEAEVVAVSASSYAYDKNGCLIRNEN